MKRLLIAAALTLAITTPVNAAERMKFTCYCPESCSGTTTASGQKVRVGIAAASSAHFGDCALIYTLDGDFIGFYECLDKGGKGIESGKVIDVWQPNLKQARELMALTGGEVMIEWVENPKG